VITIWRANLLDFSANGNQYFLWHLLGTDNAVRAVEAPPDPGRGMWCGGTRRRPASSTCC
jgi:nitrate reductase alpha subunit